MDWDMDWDIEPKGGDKDWELCVLCKREPGCDNARLAALAVWPRGSDADLKRMLLASGR
jgi:hypothetical protein